MGTTKNEGAVLFLPCLQTKYNWSSNQWIALGLMCCVSGVMSTRTLSRVAKQHCKATFALCKPQIQDLCCIEKPGILTSSCENKSPTWVCWMLVLAYPPNGVGPLPGEVEGTTYIVVALTANSRVGQNMLL